MTLDPHTSRPLRRAGAAVEDAARGLVLLHGRGASADQILGLAASLGRADLALAAPEAAGNSWWPSSFLAPHQALEPWLGSAICAVGRAVAALEAEGMPRARIGVAGFSQGACLALEYAARQGGPLAFVAALSGGLVGTEDGDGPPVAELYGHGEKRFDYAARLDGVPVHIGCHEQDPHIPKARVLRSAEVLREMGADVGLKLYPGPGHDVTLDDLHALRRLLR